MNNERGSLVFRLLMARGSWSWDGTVLAGPLDNCQARFSLAHNFHVQSAGECDDLLKEFYPLSK